MESSTGPEGQELITDAAAVVLAGGRSVRMGSDKRMIEVDGEPLLTRSIRLMRGAFSQVHVSGDRVPADVAQAADSIVPDDVPGRGPLVGILSCLKTLSAPALFFVACDAPFPSLDLARFMHERLRQAPDEVLAIVAASERGPEPLFAFYRATAVPAIERVLVESDGRVRALFDSMKVELIGPKEWETVPGAADSFINLNRPEDVKWLSGLV